MLFTLLPQFCAVAAAVGENPSPNAESKPPYLRVDVDRVVIDTQGLIQASSALADSIERLALSIERLGSDSAAFADEDRARMMRAVQSVDAASQALGQLAQELPRAARDFGEHLPQAIRDSGRPIAELSGGLRAASDSVLLISDSLPRATENAKSLVNATLDAAVLRLSIYTLALFTALALAVIAVIWFVYRQYLAPLVRKLDELTGAPEYLEAMASHMKDTSANLLQLERKAAPVGDPPAGD